MNDIVITIGRQNGSGGREVGRILADRLGIAYYDQEIISATAEESGLSREEVARSEERAGRSPFFFGGIPSPNPVFAAQSRTIAELAGKGPAVFVGRCSDYVLRNRRNVLNVFVHAPLGDRAERSSRRNGITVPEAVRRVQDTDRERAAYYNRYTGLVWGDVSNYHLSLDTAPVGVDGTADIIIAYAERAGLIR